MNSTHRELARETFVLAATIVEAAHELSVAGQSPQLNGNECERYARELQQMAQELGTTAAFLHCLSQQETTHG